MFISISFVRWKECFVLLTDENWVINRPSEDLEVYVVDRQEIKANG